MALPVWMQLVLQLVHGLSHFLLFGTFDEPTANNSDPNPSAPLTSSDSTLSSSSSPLSSRTVDFLATVFGFTLPRDVTIVHGLPTATAVLLKLTEILPPEVVLFLVLSGLTAWLFLGIILVTFVLIVICRRFVFTRLIGRVSLPIVSFAAADVIVSEPEENEDNTEPIPRPLPSPPVRPTLPPAPRRRVLPLSDAALALSGTVAAHNCSPVVPSLPRRGRRSQLPPSPTFGRAASEGRRPSLLWL